jgi:Tfp pilus assembly protein PilW
MKILGRQKTARAPRTSGERGMTITETIVAMVIFGFLVIAMVYTNIFVLLSDQLVNSKLGASDNSRIGFDRMVNDIREAKVWWVGSNNSSGVFSRYTSVLQEGNALQLSFCVYTNELYGVDTNLYVRYFFQAQTGGVNGLYTLYRLDNTKTNNPVTTVIAKNLTNVNNTNLYFRAEDYTGTILQTNDSTFVYLIHVQMNFAQYQYPLTKVGSNCYYNSYKMEFKVTPHAPDQE